MNTIYPMPDDISDWGRTFVEDLEAGLLDDQDIATEEDIEDLESKL